jgi:UDP-N-acetylenolpyruvoylglucosamine reductase
MNAGAMGGETFRQVVSVRFVDSKGEFHTRTPAEMEVHYRDVATLARNYAVSAIFRGSPAPADEIARKLEESQQKRRTSQPRESSAGCIFKNPGPVPAGKLIEELGLKGTRVGGAKVSEMQPQRTSSGSSSSSRKKPALRAELNCIPRCRLWARRREFTDEFERNAVIVRIID